MKKILIAVLITIMVSGRAEALMGSAWHLPLFQAVSLDIGAAFGRTLEAAIQYFLSDDSDLVAELVWKDGEGGGGGGCGGVYTGASGSTGSTQPALTLKAVASSLTDIPAETTAYPEGTKIATAGIDDLAKYRMEKIAKERAALDQLSQEDWAVRYRAQQRSIQALTDALVMKKAYKELLDLSNSVSEGSFSDYSAAATTVANRRLMLDALMALRKRVIAARVRARAETMEMNMESSPEAPKLDRQTETPSTTTSTSQETPDDETEHKTKEATQGIGGENDQNPFELPDDDVNKPLDTTPRDDDTDWQV